MDNFVGNGISGIKKGGDRSVKETKEAPYSLPTDSDAEAAVRTLIRWIGDDPMREGLKDTPRRVISAWREFFSGYGCDAADELARVFEDVGEYKDMVMLRGIEFHSHCEHHITPIIGHVHLAYFPVGNRVVGLSKLARVVEIFARRLQTQETMTTQIADTINTALLPAGVAVLIEAEHQCMSIRGVKKRDVMTVTTSFSGLFDESPDLRSRFLSLCNMPSHAVRSDGINSRDTISHDAHSYEKD